MKPALTVLHQLSEDVSSYYAARAAVYDETAGYLDKTVESVRQQKFGRFKELLAGKTVLEVACGTGFWTQGIAETEESVLAVDINASMLALARERCRHLHNVGFMLADAYTLDGVPTGHTAAFATYWWSHMPKECVPNFLKAQHSRLCQGAFVLIVDQLPYSSASRRKDVNGNMLEQRVLPDGKLYEIVKNFPTEIDIRNALSGMANEICYTEWPEEANWDVSYRVAKEL